MAKTAKKTTPPARKNRRSPAQRAELIRLWNEYKAAAVALSRFYFGRRKWWYVSAMVVPVNPGDDGQCSGMCFKIENPDRPAPVPEEELIAGGSFNAAG